MPRSNVGLDVGRFSTGGIPCAVRMRRGRSSDPMPEVLERTADPRVAPRGMLFRPAHGEPTPSGIARSKALPTQLTAQDSILFDQIG